LGIVFN